MKDNKKNKAGEKPKKTAKEKDKKEVKDIATTGQKKKEGQKKKPLVSEIKASARFIRVSPRKVRLVIAPLKGRSALEVLDYLKFIRKEAVKTVTKLINSALANAEHNFHLDKSDLYIKKFIVNEGPTLKRWRPRAFGRSTQISKRTSHLELILGLKPGAKPAIIKKEKKEKSAGGKEEIKIVTPDEVKKEMPKVSGKGPEEKGRSQKGFLKQIFSRKTG